MRFQVMFAIAALSIAAASSARAEEVSVLQEGKKFSASEVNIKAGDAVVFSNKDPVTHNVYSSTEGMAFDLKTQKPGASSTISFDHPGDAEVQCAIHPQMSMKVHVR
jgi:plastocyanin